MIHQNPYFYGLVLLLISYQNLSGGGTAEGWCIESEREALLEFKQGLVDESDVLSSWVKATDCCKWRGVRCSNRTRHVIALVQNDNLAPLRGKISSSLLNLKQLRYLDLSWNKFQHIRIPKFIGSLYKLQYLDLHYNDFSGTIPDEIGNLTELRYLSLGKARVSNLEWLSRLRLLRKLSLHSVDLGSMDWLATVNKLSFLSELSLPDCNLPGIIHSTNTSHAPLRVINLVMNNFRSSSNYNWLLNSSSSLVDIDMSYNPFGSSIPPFFAKLRSLEKLNLGMCGLSGEIPNFVRNLTRLSSIRLFSNNFTQPLTDIFQMLIKSSNSLETLDLGRNKINGPLPDIKMFPLLKYLSLRHNKLQGSLLKSFGQDCLEYLDLDNNELYGSIPELLSVLQLVVLNLASNTLSGRVPESIGQLSNLKMLSLSSNFLSFEFDPDWTPRFQLATIELVNCNLGPHFPRWFRSQNTLSEVDISNAKISGLVPSWFWDLSPRLIYLNLSDNQIHGMLPDLSTKYIDISALDLHSNHFTGHIPLLPRLLRVLILSKNNLSGSIIPLCQITTSLVYLDLSNNLLSGEVPDCWVHAERLKILDLANNHLSGKFPTKFGVKPSLQVLNLRHNKFEGDFSLMKNYTNLEVIDMSENKLSGKVPDWLGTSLTFLVVLNFRMNQLHGSIPQTICDLISLQFLDLSSNNISGNIPRCFDKLYSLANPSRPKQSMEYLTYGIHGVQQYVAGELVQWKGVVLEYKTTLALLKCIDLSNNKLVGYIPIELAKLEGLISLNLSRNNLSGAIMGNISQMTMLEVLDLSQNQLSGEIPSDLGKLNFLSVLDLSDNKFSGKIPSGTQLQSFGVLSYTGNIELCGLPLPKKCPGENKPDVPTTRQSNKEEEGEDTILTTGFYINLVLGFAVAFWGFFGLLLIRTPWRYAYINLVDKIIDFFYRMRIKL